MTYDHFLAQAKSVLGGNFISMPASGGWVAFTPSQQMTYVNGELSQSHLDFTDYVYYLSWIK